MNQNNNSKIWIIIAVVLGVLIVAWVLLFKPESVIAPFSENVSDPSVSKLENVGTSDDVGSIEQDLNESDFSNLVPELDSIDNELAQ